MSIQDLETIFLPMYEAFSNNGNAYVKRTLEEK